MGEYFKGKERVKMEFEKLLQKYDNSLFLIREPEDEDLSMELDHLRSEHLVPAIKEAKTLGQCREIKRRLRKDNLAIWAILNQRELELGKFQ